MSGEDIFVIPNTILNKTKILVIDDQISNLDILAYFLNSQGAVVQTLSAGEQAVAVALKFQPDLILLDVMMPGQDGYTTCKALKQNDKTSAIPVIFASALTESHDKIKGFELGAIDYISKPLELKEILARLVAHLGVHRQKNQLQNLNHKLQQEIQLRKRETDILLENQTKLQANNKLLQKLATVDALTQVGNRRCFEHSLMIEWRRAIRERTPLSLIMCDVDNFKAYNDYYGHQRGDTCLQKIAHTLLQIFKRPSDLLCRYGGEEFSVILPNTPAPGAAHMAEKMRLAVSELNLDHQGISEQDTVSISVGVSSFQPNEYFSESENKLMLQKIIETSDKALYQAKSNGRNCTVALAPEFKAQLLPLGV